MTHSGRTPAARVVHERLGPAGLRAVWLRSGGLCECRSACAGHASGECGQPLQEGAWFAEPIVPAVLGGVAVSGNYRAVCTTCYQPDAARVQPLLSLMRHIGWSAGPGIAGAERPCLQRRT